MFTVGLIGIIISLGRPYDSFVVHLLWSSLFLVSISLSIIFLGKEHMSSAKEE